MFQHCLGQDFYGIHSNTTAPCVWNWGVLWRLNQELCVTSWCKYCVGSSTPAKVCRRLRYIWKHRSTHNQTVTQNFPRGKFPVVQRPSSSRRTFQFFLACHLSSLLAIEKLNRCNKLKWQNTLGTIKTRFKMDSPMIGDIIWEEDLVHNEISLFAQSLEALATPLIAQVVIRLL